MNTRLNARAAYATLLLAAATALPAAQAVAQTEMEVDVRSSVTGRGLSKAASVKIKDQKGQPLAGAAARAAAPQRQRFAVPAGIHDLEVDVPGHRPARIALEVPAGARLPVKVWLDPEVTPEEMRPDVVRKKFITSKTMLHGHVVNDVTGEPVAGATVSLELTKSKTQTDANGYFVIYGAPQMGARTPDPDLPSTDNLVIKQAGYKTHRIVGTLLVEGDTHFIIELEPGAGKTERDDTHKLVRSAQQDALLRQPR